MCVPGVEGEPCWRALLGQYPKFEYELCIRYWVSVKFPTFDYCTMVMLENILLLRQGFPTSALLAPGFVFVVGTALCTVGCLAASLASVTWSWQAALPPRCDTSTIFKHCSHSSRKYALKCLGAKVHIYSLFSNDSEGKQIHARMRREQ